MAPKQTFSFSGYGYGSSDQAVAVLYNGDYAKGRSLNVARLSVRPAFPTSSTPGTLEVKRLVFSDFIFDYGAQLTLVPADTSSADISGDVQCVIIAKSASSATTIHSRQIMPFSGQGLTLPATGIGVPSSARVDTSCLFDSYAPVSGTQGLTINFGEALSISVPVDTQNLPINATYGLTMTVDDLGQTPVATYYVSTTLTPTALGTHSVVLGNLNVSASLKVTSVEFVYLGDPSTLNASQSSSHVRFCRVYGYVGGVVAPLVSRDPRNKDTDNIEVVFGHLEKPIEILPFISRDGVGFDDMLVPSQVRVFGRFRRSLPHMYSVLDGNTITAVASEFQGDVQHGIDQMRRISDISGIVVRPGEALAIVMDNATTYSSFYVEGVFTSEAPSVIAPIPNPMGVIS